MMNTGEQIRAIREAERLSQQELANALEVSVATLRNWEQGRREPLAPVLKAIGKLWPKYSQWLLTGTTSPESGQVSPEQEKARRDSARDGTHG